MKYFATAGAICALLSLAGPASAQMYSRYYAPMWPEMVDNGCCTDHPTHSPTDFVAGQLNQQVLNFNAQPPVYPMPMYGPRY